MIKLEKLTKEDYALYREAIEEKGEFEIINQGNRKKVKFKTY